MTTCYEGLSSNSFGYNYNSTAGRISKTPISLYTSTGAYLSSASIFIWRACALVKFFLLFAMPEEDVLAPCAWASRSACSATYKQTKMSGCQRTNIHREGYLLVQLRKCSHTCALSFLFSVSCSLNSVLSLALSVRAMFICITR